MIDLSKLLADISYVNKYFQKLIGLVVDKQPSSSLLSSFHSFVLLSCVPLWYRCMNSGISFSAYRIQQQRQTKLRSFIDCTDEESWLDTGLLLGRTFHDYLEILAIDKFATLMMKMRMNNFRSCFQAAQRYTGIKWPKVFQWKLKKSIFCSACVNNFMGIVNAYSLNIPCTSSVYFL